MKLSDWRNGTFNEDLIFSYIWGKWNALGVLKHLKKMPQPWVFSMVDKYVKMVEEAALHFQKLKKEKQYQWCFVNIFR